MAESKVVYKGDGFDISLTDRDDVSGTAQSIRSYVQSCAARGESPDISHLCVAYAGVLCNNRVYEHMPLEDIITGAVQLGYGFRVWEADQEEQARISQMLDDMAPNEEDSVTEDVIRDFDLVREQYPLQFRECDVCAATPGSPTLCAGCLHNRGAIEHLRKMASKGETE